MPDQRGVELRSFLRAMRARLRPEDVGLPVAGRRRRAAGLRVEEAAALAGVSLTWYSALERGTGARVSENLLSRVGDALRLTPDERDMLAALASARKRQPVDDGGLLLRAIVDGFTTGPAFVSDRFWHIEAYNAIADAVYGISAAGERNLLARMLLEPAMRDLHAQWERIAQQMVAIAHLAFANRLDDPRGIELVERLNSQSPHFRRWWSDYTVRRFVPTAARLHHPSLGPLSLLYTSFIATGLPPADVPLVIMLQPAADDATRAALGSLREPR